MEDTGPGPVRLLTRSEVRKLLGWPELIEAAERALVALATSDSVAATSSQLRVPHASLHLKSGALDTVLSVKANLRPDAGTSDGVVLAFDPVRFTLRAILDSADITAMRTAAMAAVAARRLARAGDHSVAVVGAGPVGRHSLAALRGVVPVRDTVVADVLADALVVGELAYLPDTFDRAACAELGAVLAGRRELGDDGGRVVFDSVGSAVVDAAVTEMVLTLAERDEAGTLFGLGA